jgi:GT2 family glycosyltransferase
MPVLKEQRERRAGVASAPRISVIIPTYNYARFISQALESVQAQTYPDWECLVVDDGSTDNTGEVVAHHRTSDLRIRYIRQANQGLAAARNAGIANSVGAYLQFLDADDRLEAAKLERHVGYLERNRELDIVYGSVRYFRTEAMEERRYSLTDDNTPWMPEISGNGKDVLLALVRHNIMAVNAALIRRTIVDDVGVFDTTLPVLEDWDYWIRCAARGKRFQYVSPEGALALVRSHPSSLSTNTRRMLATSLAVRKKIELVTVDADTLKVNRDILASTQQWLAHLDLIAQDLQTIVRPGTVFVLVDDNQFRSSLSLDHHAIPFLERDGQYWGPPPDDATAIRELERLRQSGASFMVFAWPAFWWLDYYAALRQHLRSAFRCVLENDRLVVFDLRARAGSRQEGG